jgi:alpha-tubulin suppressor-like RCC1 family protein
MEQPLQRRSSVQRRFAPSIMIASIAALAPLRALPCEEDAGVTVTPAISVGTWHTCAVGSDGVARCWGSNTEKQLGNGTLRSSATPVRVPIDRAVVQIAAGYTHTCALDVEGVVWCWGDNRDGELGDGTREARARPAPVRGLSDVIAVAAGTFHSCALRVDGTVYCWGNGILGTLGDGRNHTSDLPVPVSGITDAVAIATGEDHACAVHASGRLSCWGRNTWGQLGDGTKDDSNVPRRVLEYTATRTGWVTKALEGAVAVGAGYAHTCVLHADGKVSCWGANWYGQLGNGSKSDTTSPVAVLGATRAKAIALGSLESCALLSDGTARCWGSNVYGQLGDGTTRDALKPVALQRGSGPLGGLVAIAAGGNGCAVDAAGAMWCWGAGYTGQLGDGKHENRAVPGRVSFSGSNSL